MLKVGLTGGIGSGKSTVAQIFKSLGVPVYFADKAAKRLMNTHPDIKKAITEKFGEEAYNGDELNRAYIASIVFNNKQRLAQLNELVHPITIKDANEWFLKQDTKYALKEAALIFESHSDQYLDYIIGVSAPKQTRIERTMLRDHIKAEEVIQRMSKQMDENEKIKRCDFVIDNSGTCSVISQVLSLHVVLTGLASQAKDL